jgi:hypothetical protein
MISGRCDNGAPLRVEADTAVISEFVVRSTTVHLDVVVARADDNVASLLVESPEFVA